MKVEFNKEIEIWKNWNIGNEKFNKQISPTQSPINRMDEGEDRLLEFEDRAEELNIYLVTKIN